jgi:hypothetical protein
MRNFACGLAVLLFGLGLATSAAADMRVIIVAVEDVPYSLGPNSYMNSPTRYNNSHTRYDNSETLRHVMKTARVNTKIVHQVPDA